MEDKICIIVPVKEDSDTFRKCVYSLLSLNYENYEIIIVDDSEKGVIKKISFPEKIKILCSYGKGPSFARNLAAKNTDVKFLAFTDSDCVVDRNWLKELLRGFEEYPDAVACGGVQRLPFDAVRFEKRVFAFMKKAGLITDYIRKIKKQAIIEVNHNASCNVMYRREIFLQEGGFLEGLWPGEDVELDYRIKKKGYKIVFNPKAVVYHYKPKEIKTFLRTMFRYGWAQGVLVRKYGVFRKVQILPFLSLVLLLSFFFSLFSKFIFFSLFFLAAVVIISFGYLGFDFTLFTLALLGFIYWNIGFIRGMLFINSFRL